nr:MAG TPA: hypothetical protein [Caudoviricetes sp.]
MVHGQASLLLHTGVSGSKVTGADLEEEQTWHLAKHMQYMIAVSCWVSTMLMRYRNLSGFH